MANRIGLLAAAVAALVFCGRGTVFAQAPPGQRPPQNYGSDPNAYPKNGYPNNAYAYPNDGNPNNSYPDRSVPQAGNGQQSQQQPQQQRQDIPRGPAAPQNPPAPPFVLNRDEQVILDRILDAWEKQNGQIKTFKCKFTKSKYDLVFMTPRPGEDPSPIRVSSGEIKYAAPDKGLIIEDSAKGLTTNKTQQLEWTKQDALDHWACDGKVLSQVDHVQKTVEQFPIPPELQGQAITQGPLPFVFGAKAIELKSRYYIRAVPSDSSDIVRLDIRPKNQHDAANFSQVELILRAKDMFPAAIRVHFNVNEYELYQLQDWTILDSIFNYSSFSPSPFGYKVIKHAPTGAAAPQQGAAPPSGGQAQRPVYDGRRQ